MKASFTAKPQGQPPPAWVHSPLSHAEQQAAASYPSTGQHLTQNINTVIAYWHKTEQSTSTHGIPQEQFHHKGYTASLQSITYGYISPNPHL
jgi:hypothetical protein